MIVPEIGQRYRWGVERQDLGEFVVTYISDQFVIITYDSGAQEEAIPVTTFATEAQSVSTHQHRFYEIERRPVAAGEYYLRVVQAQWDMPYENFDVITSQNVVEL